MCILCGIGVKLPIILTWFWNLWLGCMSGCVTWKPRLIFRFSLPLDPCSMLAFFSQGLWICCSLEISSAVCILIFDRLNNDNVLYMQFNCGEFWPLLIVYLVLFYTVSISLSDMLWFKLHRYSDSCCGQGSLGRTLHIWWRFLQASHFIFTTYWSKYKGKQPTLICRVGIDVHLNKWLKNSDLKMSCIQYDTTVVSRYSSK